MKPLDADQQAHFNKLIGEARVTARELAEQKAATAAGKLGDDAQEVAVLKRIADAETAARATAKVDFEAEAVRVATKAAEDAATAKLVKDKEWEDLATQHSTKLAAQTAELEPLKVKVAAYETLVADMLKDRLEALGDAAKAAVEGLPGEPGDLDKLVWLNQNEGLFEQGDPPAGAVGTPRKKGKVPAKKPVSTDGKEPAPKRISRWPLRL